MTFGHFATRASKGLRRLIALSIQSVHLVEMQELDNAAYFNLEFPGSNRVETSLSSHILKRKIDSNDMRIISIMQSWRRRGLGNMNSNIS